MRGVGFLVAVLAAVLALAAPASAEEVPSIDGRLLHTGFYVEPRQFGVFEFRASRGTAVAIIAYIIDVGGNFTDVEVMVVRPDGTLERQRERVEAHFAHWFVAPMDGAYKVLFYNGHPEMRKYVDIAVAGIPQAQPQPGAGSPVMPQVVVVTVTEKGGEGGTWANILGLALVAAVIAALFAALLIKRK